MYDRWMQERRIQLGTGLAYHVLEWEAESDHTVILLHGFLDLAWGWVRTVESGLRGRFHLVAPDFRGHGDSDRVGAGGYYHFADYTADLHSLIELVGRTRVSLVGHSMGGGVATNFSGTFPERVHRLALLEGLGPPPQLPNGPERTRQWITQWAQARTRTPPSYATLDEAAARLVAHDPRLDAAEAHVLAEHGTEIVDGRYRFKHDPVHLTIGPNSYHPDVAERFWSAITCPTLLVDAAESELRAKYEDWPARRSVFRHARTVELPDCGHMMQRHQPAALAALLAEFLDS
jgi:pimeloyl-ACP methyl ester carboxylesterase